MPYAPGIQDRSGEIRAQGIVAAGNNYGSAMATAGQQFQAFQQNKLLATQAVGQIEGALRANPELMGILSGKTASNPNAPQPPSQAAQAFMKLQKNGALPMQEAALLSQYVQAYGGAKQQKQQEDLQKAQLAQAQFGLDAEKFKLGQMQAAVSEEAALNARIQERVRLGRQLQSGVGSGVLRPEVQKAVQEFMGSSAGQLAQQGVKLTPAMMQKLAETDRQYPTHAPSPKAQMVTMGTDAYGRVIQGIEQPNGTFARIPETPKNVLSPEEEILKAEGIKVSEAHVEANKETIAAGTKALEEIPRIKTALDILKSPDVRTGPAATVELALKRAVGSLGIDVKGVADAEQLQSILGENILSKVDKMKGQLSDKDVKFIDELTASVSKSNEGNIQILDALMALQQRAVENARTAYRLRAKGVREGAINKTIFDYNDQNPIFGGEGTPAAPAPLPPLEVYSIGPKK